MELPAVVASDAMDPLRAMGDSVPQIPMGTDSEIKMADDFTSCGASDGQGEATVSVVIEELSPRSDPSVDDKNQSITSAHSKGSDSSMEGSLLGPTTPREGVTSPMSQNSQPEDELRLGAVSSLSREDSSLAWLREACLASASGQEEEFVSARESPSSNTSGDSGSAPNSFRAGELVNNLVEGPCITLPPTELPTVSLSKCEPPKSLSVSNVESVLIESEGKTGVNGSASEHTGTETTSPQPSSRPSIETESQEDVERKQSVGEERPTPTSQVAESESGPSSSPAQSSVPEKTPATPNAQSSSVPAKPRVKKTPNDFIFGKVIGEGSYSTVYLAKEVSTQTEFAIKVCDKKHLIRERKTHFVMREKEVLMRLDHPFFIKLAYTFQDPDRLYYVLTYARNGELLGYLHKLSAFDLPCTRFYTAEVVLALEYLHSLGIVHRDLKPENILLSDDMHIKITDFGTSKVLAADSQGEAKRKNSFVGTAEYVSPEVLNNQPANFGSDLWGLGCIIYQCLSGSLPFRSGNEYQTFQKIVKVEYDFPEGFNEDAKDLVTKLLVLEPSERLGMSQPDGMNAIKSHPFYDCIKWDTLPQATPPKLMPYLPATANNPEFWGQEQRTGFDDQRLAEIITGQTAEGTQSPELEEVTFVRPASEVEEEKRREKLKKQRLENQFHPFVEDNLILRQGFVDKRKGLFARKRMLLLTEGPHLYYVDAHNKVLKGEIPWSDQLRPEAKNFKIFFVHTPNRTYYLESRMPDAHLWVKKIEEVRKKYYGQ